MRTPPRIPCAAVRLYVWRRRWAVAVLLAAAVAGGVLAVRHHMQLDLRYRLLATSPFEVADHPELVRFAIAEAKPLYAAHCASCHGVDMSGNTTIGAPNLKDRFWIYGDGGVYEIERTILFGIRDARARTRDVTEMPAFGQRGILTESQVQDMVQYILKLNNRPYDAEAASEGPKIFYSDNASCFDCHASDARGDSNYGAPNLTANIWTWGGSPQDLYNSIYYGRHGVMPGWLGALDLEQIRALAVYLHAVSAGPPGAKPAQSAAESQ